MIDRLKLTDFQCHESQTIKLGPVTTFVGPSDSGKSAYLRALRWLCENKPAGTGFIRTGADTAEVAARVDGKWILRARSNRDNTYQLGEQLYQSLRGAGIPEDIAQLLNLGPMSFQGQLDSPYLLTETGGDAAKSLNAVVNLTEIDEIMARAAADIRQLRAAAGVTETRLAAAETARDAAEWAVGADAELTELAEQETALNDWRAGITQLAELITEIDGREVQLEEMDDVAVCGAGLVAFATVYREITEQRERLEALLIDIAAQERIVGVNPADNWAALLEIRTAGDAVATERRELETLVRDIEKEQGEWERYERELMETKAELLREMGGKCPMCGQAASPENLLPVSCQTHTSAPESPSRGGRVAARSGLKPK